MSESLCLWNFSTCHESAQKKGISVYLVYWPQIDIFPFDNEPHTTEINKLRDFKSDAIFVPGNEVPHYLRGV
ncbi:MAG: hypothetical protein WBN17_10515, partial [Aureibaculum sp.]